MTHTNYIFYTFSQGLQILWHPKKNPRIYGILVKVIQSQQRCQSALNTEMGLVNLSNCWRQSPTKTVLVTTSSKYWTDRWSDSTSDLGRSEWLVTNQHRSDQIIEWVSGNYSSTYNGIRQSSIRQVKCLGNYCNQNKDH